MLYSNRSPRPVRFFVGALMMTGLPRASIRSGSRLDALSESGLDSSRGSEIDREQFGLNLIGGAVGIHA